MKKCKLKIWFGSNKIYFEIFSSFFLGIMAIIVSICSLIISNKQLKNDELLNKPLIKISYEQFTYKEQNDSEKITIENVGGYAYNYDINKKVFLHCEYTPSNGLPSKTIDLLINDILDTSSPTNNYTGSIGCYYTFANMEYFYKLYNQAINIKKGILFIELHKYISISYLDFKEQQHKDLFRIYGVRQGVKIQSTDEINNLLSIDYPSYYISNITMEQLLDSFNVKPD